MFIVDGAGAIGSMYWLQVHKEYAKWSNDRADKNLPYIALAEYEDAQAKANSFVLSKDRPWKLRNWLAYFIGRVFL